jgi:hypothetical protein
VVTVEVDPAPEWSKAATTPRTDRAIISEPTIQSQTGSRFFAGTVKGGLTTEAGLAVLTPSVAGSGSGSGGGGAPAGCRLAVQARPFQ